MSSRETDGTSRRLFWAVMLLIPVAFFGLIEGGLRLGGYGSDHSLFEPVPGYENYLQPSSEAGRRYFARTSIVPAPMHDAFRREKTPQTLRLFVQGASTAAGFPYGHGGSFSRMLEQRLAATLPDRDVEVVNLAMAAVSSHTVRDQVDEIIAQQPDAVLIYAGHNEYYGALGAASTESLGAATRLYLAIDHFRIVQGLRQLFASLTARPPSSESATLMQELARERSIPMGSPLYERGLRQYADNLRVTLCEYREAGVPVFVATLASNERHQPPFVSGLSPQTDSASWTADFNRVISTLDPTTLDPRSPGPSTIDFPPYSTLALTILDSLIAVDDRSADAYYARARLHLAGGDTAQARRDFIAAKDRDELRFRAPQAMNEIVRDAASQCGAAVVDTRGALADASPAGIIGRELMLEHLHPNIDGYFLLADAFYEAVGEAGVGGSWSNRIPPHVARADVLVTPLDSALASLHVRRLLNNWPFQPAGVTRPDTITVSTSVDQLALDVLRGQRTWLDATAALGARYESEGNLNAALRVARALIQEKPYDPQPYLLAGNILARQQRWGPAYSYFHASEARRPSADARRMAGHTMVRSGRPGEAVPWLEGALKLDPNHRGALYDLAVAYAETGRQNEAQQIASKLLNIAPDDPGAQRLAARLDL